VFLTKHINLSSTSYIDNVGRENGHQDFKLITFDDILTIRF